MGRARNLLLAIAVMTVSLLAGCDAPGNDYAAYINLPREGWKYGDTLVFIPVHPDSVCRGRIVIGVRHSNDFPYTSLWLEATVIDGSRRVKDTLEVRLADEFGSWTGRGIGATFQTTDTLQGTFLHRSGTPVKIRHIMRRDTLPSLEQLGVFFLPV